MPINVSGGNAGRTGAGGQFYGDANQFRDNYQTLYPGGGGGGQGQQQSPQYGFGVQGAQYAQPGAAGVTGYGLFQRAQQPNGAPPYRQIGDVFGGNPTMPVPQYPGTPAPPNAMVPNRQAGRQARGQQMLQGQSVAPGQQFTGQRDTTGRVAKDAGPGQQQPPPPPTSGMQQLGPLPVTPPPGGGGVRTGMDAGGAAIGGAIGGALGGLGTLEAGGIGAIPGAGIGATIGDWATGGGAAQQAGDAIGDAGKAVGDAAGAAGAGLGSGLGTALGDTFNAFSDAWNQSNPNANPDYLAMLQQAMPGFQNSSLTGNVDQIMQSMTDPAAWQQMAQNRMASLDQSNLAGLNLGERRLADRQGRSGLANNSGILGNMYNQFAQRGVENNRNVFNDILGQQMNAANVAGNYAQGQRGQDLGRWGQMANMVNQGVASNWAGQREDNPSAAALIQDLLGAGGAAAGGLAQGAGGLAGLLGMAMMA